MYQLIKSLSDYLLLNSFTLGSSGLYQGKAGVALSLMKSGQIINNEYTEQMASELIMQAILSKTTNIFL